MRVVRSFCIVLVGAAPALAHARVPAEDPSSEAEACRGLQDKADALLADYALGEKIGADAQEAILRDLQSIGDAWDGACLAYGGINDALLAKRSADVLVVVAITGGQPLPTEVVEGEGEYWLDVCLSGIPGGTSEKRDHGQTDTVEAHCKHHGAILDFCDGWIAGAVCDASAALCGMLAEPCADAQAEYDLAECDQP